MDNYCLIGLGFIGLLILSSKKQEKKIELSNLNFEHPEIKNLFNLLNTSLDDTYSKVEIDDNIFISAEWKINRDNFEKEDLHSLLNLDYIKISNDNIILGKYCNISDEFVHKLKLISNNISVSEDVPDICENMKFIKVINNCATLSAITINFIENINRYYHLHY